MSSNISLYTISAVLILDKDGSRLFAKYYQRHDDTLGAPAGSTPENSDLKFLTVAQQIAFEKAVFSKINKVHQDILLYDNHLITYRQVNDVVIVMVAKITENESLVYSAVSNLYEAIRILLDYSLDSATILDKFDLVALAIDETIEEGILIEIDPAVIVSRVTSEPKEEILASNIELNEKTLFSAFSLARRFGEKLQQSL